MSKTQPVTIIFVFGSLIEFTIARGDEPVFSLSVSLGDISVIRVWDGDKWRLKRSTADIETEMAKYLPDGYTFAMLLEDAKALAVSSVTHDGATVWNGSDVEELRGLARHHENWRIVRDENGVRLHA